MALKKEKKTASKELEALGIIKIKCHPNSNPSPLVDDALNILEQALIELEQLRERDRFNSIGKSIQYCKNEVIK